jgi:hypothetical protein
MIKVKLDFRFSWCWVWRWLSSELLRCVSLVEGYWRFRGACCLHHCPDGGGSKHFWNISNLLPDYMVQQPRRQPFSSLNYFSLKLSVTWQKEEILHCHLRHYIHFVWFIILHTWCYFMAVGYLVLFEFSFKYMDSECCYISKWILHKIQ